MLYVNAHSASIFLQDSISVAAVNIITIIHICLDVSSVFHAGMSSYTNISVAAHAGDLNCAIQ